MSSLQLVYAGTPDFAVPPLRALMQSEHRVLAVYTQPDRPAGRGLQLKSSPVKAMAEALQLPVQQPASLKHDEAIQSLTHYAPDVLVVCAYGLLIPAAVLRIPRLGCVNIHPSLLPRYRGAAPIQRALEAGEDVTGVTIMQMDHGLDTGPILLQQSYAIQPHDTSQTLHDALSQLGATALIDALDQLAQQRSIPVPQDHQQATYAHKLSKEEALLDWSQSAKALELKIRAFNPWPVAYTSWQGHTLRIWNAKALQETSTASPRTIVRADHDGVDVATASGVLRLLTVQPAGSRVMTIGEFYNARHETLMVGTHLI